MSNKIYRLRFSRVVAYSIGLILFMYAFEGPLRYYSHKVGFNYFFYLKDVILFAVFMLLIVRGVVRSFLPAFFLKLAFALGFFGLVGIWHELQITQVLFVYKIFLLLIVGVLSFDFLPDNMFFFWRLLNFLAIASCFGVFADLVVDFPWALSTMEVGGVEVAVSRTTWASGGFPRVSGFGRVWSNPAYFVLLASLFNLLFLNKKSVHFFFLALIYFFGIAVTTNKGALGSFLLIHMFFIVKDLVPQKILKGGIISLLAVIIILPLLSWAGLLQHQPESFLGRIAFSSFFVRINEMWPRALVLILEHGNVIFGRGVGGIGAAQKVFEVSLNHPADNVFIYLYGAFGVVGVLFLLFLGYKLTYVDFNGCELGLFCVLLFICFLGIGLIGSALENGVLNYFLGLMFAGFATNSKRLSKTQSYE